MAYGSPSTVAWRSQSGETNPVKSDGQGYKNIYVPDTSFESYYKNHVSVKNPVADGMESAIAGEGSHVQESINFFKTIDIKIVYGHSSYTGWDAQKSSGWGNWRNQTIKVDPRVMLRMEDLSKIGMSFSQDFGYAWDEVAGSGALGKVADMAKKLQNAAAMMAVATGSSANLDTSTPMGKYQKVPYLKAIQPFKTEPGSLTFNFNFGQAGIFSGEQEVVRPIIALAKIFIPYQDGDGTWGNLSVPTQSQVYASIAGAMSGFLKSQGQQLSGFMDDMGSAISGDIDWAHPLDSMKKAASDVVTTASNVATNFIKGMYYRIDNGLASAMGKAKSISLRVGRYQLPPCFPSEVSWSFDFTHVDEYGFPLKGSITFGGLQSPKCAESSDITI